MSQSPKLFSSYAAQQFHLHNQGAQGKDSKESETAQKAKNPVFQYCQDCGAIQYPSREVCHSCLSSALDWKELSGAGGTGGGNSTDDMDATLATVVTQTALYHSLEEHYLEQDLQSNPWHILTVRLEAASAGPSLLVHASKPYKTGDTVRLFAVADYRGATCLLAVSPEEDPDAVWQQLNSKP